MSGFSAEAVKAQLARVLASEGFANGPKLAQLLNYVVDQTLSGQENTIKQYTVGVEGLGYGSQFDPGTSPTVRMLARRVRRALDQYYSEQGATDPIRISIPKGSYIPTFTDNTPTRKAINANALAAPSVEQIHSGIAEPAVAVIAFENLSDQDNGSVIANGLTEELLVALTRFSELKVLGPLTLGSDGRQIEYAQVYQEYGARFALRGAVRADGSRIRINTDLIDTTTGRNQWGETFQYDLDDTSLFEIEDEVASQVSGALADDLGVIFRKLQSESYEEHIKPSDVTFAILAYNHGWVTHNAKDIETANIAIGRALEKHPDNALLLALQSNIYYGEVLYGLDLVPDALAKMQKLANRAVSLDSKLQIAQYNLVVQNAYFGRIEQCIETAHKVVELNPNHARILAGCALAVTTVGDYRFGLDLINNARRLNPHYPSWYHLIDYLADFCDEKYEEAWRLAQLVHMDGLLWHPLIRVAALGKLGRAKDAKPHIDELLEIKPDFTERPGEYIRPLIVTDEHVDMILDGLQKAGI